MDVERYFVRVKKVDSINKKVELELVPSQEEGKERKSDTVRLTYEQKIENELIKASEDGNEISVEIKDGVVTKMV